MQPGHPEQRSHDYVRHGAPTLFAALEIATGHPPRHLRTVRDLTTKIRQFINGWNDRKHPFIWTKTPEEILAKINRLDKALHVITVTRMTHDPNTNAWRSGSPKAAHDARSDAASNATSPDISLELSTPYTTRRRLDRHRSVDCEEPDSVDATARRGIHARGVA
jgi:hypothetical protein